MGEAYAFFDCNARPEEVKKVLEEIRVRPTSPEGLEILVESNLSKLRNGSPGLDEVLQAAEAGKMGFGMRATIPGLSNMATADNTEVILWHFYHSPLYEPNKAFRNVLILYHEGYYQTKRK